MTTMEDLRLLVDQPMERLDAEYKDWLDLSENHGRATLAKAAIALANHGGGYIVIGLAEDGASFTSKAKPADCPEITQDAVNSAVRRYAEPAFQCAMRTVPHHSGIHHPVIVVPGNLTVPVMSKRELQGVIQLHRCYIRKPGPLSEEPRTQEEWRTLLNRCVRANRDEMLDAIRAIVTGQVEAQNPVPNADDELRGFCAAAYDRWQELTSKLPNGFPARFPHGYYEIGLSLLGATPANSLRELDQRLDVAGRVNLTGWPPFLRMDSPEWRPYSHDGFSEAWLGRPATGRTFSYAANCDFWRVSREGMLYTIRGYGEDDDRMHQYGEPGSCVNIVIPIWRIGEALLFVARFAECFDSGGQIAVLCRFTGLNGRRLVSTDWRIPPIGSQISRTGEVSQETQAAVSQIQDNLAEVVHKLLSPLYEAFGFYELPLPLVQSELQRMRERRF